ncbi:MAG: 8-amino-7-oxononanoate synthase [Carboxylicivirga sp.]|jgi:8-amino-7-oxononanoate synthase|nr:8-amino-7-oxononanoate synthase [Carboxylicivirga sp.]
MAGYKQGGREMNVDQQLKHLQEQGQLRSLKTIGPEAGAYCTYMGRRLLNLTSNDYLGLANDKAVKQTFLKETDIDKLMFGASSSRLLTGNNQLYDEVEGLLTSLYKAKSALFFNSGYHANMGILPALTDKHDLILSDKLCHASIIDGIRLCQADHLRYHHMDYEQLASILNKKRQSYKRVFIVTESVFSMDGDLSDLQKLVAIKNKFDCILYVDEAHAVGVSGDEGLGLCEQQGMTNQIDILIGTLGKAYASVGAFAILNDGLKQLLVNKARTLIYTTALPPVNMAWTRFILERIPGFKSQRQQLRSLSAYLFDALRSKGYIVHQSHIMPVMVGDNKVAVQLADHLQKQGFLVLPIRPPTVPINTARLRISLTANMQQEQLEQCMQSIPDYKKEY